MAKKALLVVSFGTTYCETRERTITATENALAAAIPGYDLKRAFTSHNVMKKLLDRDALAVDSVKEVMEKMAGQGYAEVLVQPLHVIPGIEFEMVLSELAPYEHRFSRLSVGRPLLGGAEDLQAVVNILRERIPEEATGEALVLMGHGSRHKANAVYTSLEEVFRKNGLGNVFIATVEGIPTLESILPDLKAGGYRRVTLMPLMLVAGDHAQNDMAGNEDDSWRSILTREGFEVSIDLTGLGEIEGIRRLYIEHAKQAIVFNSPQRGEAS